MNTRNPGFTLIEMAVVLVVIALVIGGVIMGRDMIRNAQLRSISGDVGKYVQAVGNFREKYKALPGDMANATTYWTAAAACPAATVGRTCNGDGDGRIITQGSGGETATHYEQFTAWQQLALAGMVEGTFTGAAGGSGTQDRRPGTNVPSSQVPGAGWGLVSITLKDISDTADCSANIPYNTGDIPPNHLLWFGGQSTGTSYCNNQSPVLTGGEAKAIDDKMDDGIPVTGRVVSQVNGSGTACASSNAYNAAASGLICALVFKTGF